MKKIILVVSVLFIASTSAFAANGTIIVKYTPEAKQNLIHMGLLAPQNFQGNLLILDKSTDLDVTLLLDEENAPAQTCFSGNPGDAGSVLDRVIENADGNGDYWVSKVRITVTKNLVRGSFTLTGEGGPERHTVSVPACK